VTTEEERRAVADRLKEEKERAMVTDFRFLLHDQDLIRVGYNLYL